MDLGHHLQEEILRKLRHGRPVLDVGTELDLHLGIRNPLGVKHTVLIYFGVKMIFIFADRTVKVRGRGEHALVCRRGRNRAGIHERNGSDLSVLELGALPVREVSGGVADTEGVVCRRVARTEAGTAESGL